MLKLRLGQNTIWTRDNTTHSVPFGYVQIFKLLNDILPVEFQQPMKNVIVDIGANEGHWALYMHQHHPDAAIIAIEPNPNPLDLMKRNIISNNLENITVLPVAICDSNTTSTFETIDNVTSLGSFAIDRKERPWLTDERVRLIEVQCKRLDDLLELQDYDTVDLIKIDVEGAEVEVLKSAKKTLQKTRRLEVEYNNNENRQIVIEMLQNEGFKLLLEHPYREGCGDLFFYKLASSSSL